MNNRASSWITLAAFALAYVGIWCGPWGGAPPAKAQPSPQSSQTQVFGAFTQNGAGVVPNVTNSSTRTALGTSGPVAQVCNTGSNGAHVRLGSSSVVALVTDYLVPAGQCHGLNATGATNVAAITDSSTTTLFVTVGTGSPMGFGGGSTGGTTTVTGNTGGYSFQLSPTITVQNASYSAGNSEGGLITLTGAARTNGGTGTIAAMRLRSAGGSTNSIWIYGWSKTPASTCTDKAAFVHNAADSPYALPGFPVQVTLGGNPGSWDTSTYAQVAAINAIFKNQDTSPGTAIYLCLVTAASVTPATTSDLSMVAGGLQD